MSFSHHLTPFWNKALGQNLKSNKRFVVEVVGRWPQPHSFQFFIYIFLFLICRRCHFMLSINTTYFFYWKWEKSNQNSRFKERDAQPGAPDADRWPQVLIYLYLSVWALLLTVPITSPPGGRSPPKVRGGFSAGPKSDFFFFFSSIFICQVFDFLLMANFPFSHCCS